MCEQDFLFSQFSRHTFPHTFWGSEILSSSFSFAFRNLSKGRTSIGRIQKALFNIELLCIIMHTCGAQIKRLPVENLQVDYWTRSFRPNSVMVDGKKLIKRCKKVKTFQLVVPNAGQLMLIRSKMVFAWFGSSGLSVDRFRFVTMELYYIIYNICLVCYFFRCNLRFRGTLLFALMCALWLYIVINFFLWSLFLLLEVVAFSTQSFSIIMYVYTDMSCSFVINK